MANHLPLMLLHAFPFHSGLFAETALPAGWTVHTPDRRGFGRTPLASSGGAVPTPDLSVLVDDVIRRLDAIGAQKAIVGGVSMGGYVSLALLASHPDRVAGLVLADTRCTVDGDDERARRLDMATRADTGQVPSGQELVAALLAVDAHLAVRRRMAVMAADAASASLAWAQRAMAARSDTAAALAATNVPVLVIVGEHDAVTPIASARTMAEAAHNATLVIIPGAGHLTPVEAPVEFSTALRTWLAAQW